MRVESTQPILSRAFRANIPTTKSQTENILGVSGIRKHHVVGNAIGWSTLHCFDEYPGCSYKF